MLRTNTPISIHRIMLGPVADLTIENIDAAYPSGTTTFSAVEGEVTAQNSLYVCSSCWMRSINRPQYSAAFFASLASRHPSDSASFSRER